MSVSFYNSQGQPYYQATVRIDMSELYAPFLSRIPSGGHILDAGCGSGRDTKEFLERGYRVTAIDASIRMVELSSSLVGQATLHLPFQEVTFESIFDGIWACASLLHVPTDEIDGVIARFTTALKLGGACYMSFKLGKGTHIDGGRMFVDYDEDSIQALLNHHPSLHLEKMWRTIDKKTPDLRNYWINALISKAS